MAIFHIVAFFIIVIAQLIAGLAYFRLKKLKTDQAKRTFYITVLLLQIVSALIVTIVLPASDIWSIHESAARFPGFTLILVISVGYVLITFILPIILLLSGYQPFIDSVKQNMIKQSDLHPVKHSERLLYTIVVFSIGISEEIVYRSFFVQYFRLLPFDLSWTMSFVLATVLFAFMHFKQGISGVWNALMLGMLFSCLFIVTGNLLWPIIVHILYDLKIVLISYIAAKKNT